MSRVKSIFGPYADKLQVMVDASQDKFAPVWFGQYFDWGIPKISLSYETVIGRTRIEAAASVVAHQSSAPLRSRDKLEKLTGEVAAIKEKFQMTESDYRDYLTLQSLNVDEQTKKKALLDLMFSDVKRVGDASMKRIDMMVLQAISTGKISMTATNNPDGIVTGDIDLLMPADNFKKVTEKWSIPASAKPITDIKNIVEAAEDKGRSFAKMLMTRTTFWKLQKCDETLSMMAGYFRMGTNQKRVGTIDEINEMLSSNGFPTIELVNESIGVESDGIISVQKPFKDTSVSFIPAGKLGVINNAIPIEQMKPVNGISYATYNNGLISKWSETDPYTEWTAVELKAFPGVSAIDAIYILDVETKA